ncbi:MAG: polyamine aminopropyltransferase [Turicibacter sp.]|nr:polyamine aminopropyltransferase [Turicibacter sp.]
MELWFTELHTENVRFSIKVDRHVHSEKSDFQQIDIFDTPEFGRILTIDGIIMLTEKDEAIYHDMITHTALATNPNIQNVLVVGGGDGGTVRELTRYSTIKKIDMVDIDKMVVDVSRNFLKQTSNKLDDPRVSLYFEDGVKFVKKVGGYDLIIVDSTDPIGPGEGLFTEEFYRDCFKALTEDGILINQHETPCYEFYANAMARAHKHIKALFPICKVYQAHIPTYQSGHWLFGFASKKFDPIKDFKADEWNKLALKTYYYNTTLHTAAFALPTYVIEKLGD